MHRRALLLGTCAALAACGPVTPPPLPPMGADGQPIQRIYRIAPGDLPRIQFRALDAINTLRAAGGLAQMELDAQLNAAAATHSRDMSFQQRPWHFGSDGSSPIERARRAGYGGRMLGELISETFESELETINAWMAEPDTRRVILDPEARDMGFAYHQDDNGKLWWTLVTGAPASTPMVPFG